MEENVWERITGPLMDSGEPYYYAFKSRMTFNGYDCDLTIYYLHADDDFDPEAASMEITYEDETGETQVDEINGTQEIINALDDNGITVPVELFHEPLKLKGGKKRYQIKSRKHKKSRKSRKSKKSKSRKNKSRRHRK